MHRALCLRNTEVPVWQKQLCVTQGGHMTTTKTPIKACDTGLRGSAFTSAVLGTTLTMASAICGN